MPAAGALIRALRAGAAACVLAGLTACATLGGPELDDLPRVEPREQPPLILIPGLLASRLIDPETDRRVWPPNLLMLFTGWRMRELEMPVPFDPTARPARLTPTGLVLSRPRRDYYASLLDALETAGYDCVPQHRLTAETSCVLFSWDWRRGFVTAAADLQQLVDEIRARRGDPALRVDLIGHSAGAMIARYFAAFGGADVVTTDAAAVPDPGPSSARRLVLIGPPNDGSLFGAQRLVRGYRLSVLTVRPEVLATFESAYQLLPHPAREWLVDHRGRPVERDLYDADTWRELGASIFDPAVRERVASRFDSASQAEARLRALERRFAEGLKRGRRFHEAISRAADVGAPDTDFLVVGSDCEPTPRRLLVEEIDGRRVLRLHPDEVARPLPGIDYAALMRDPGDGRVTRKSLLALNRARAAPGASGAAESHFVLICERHSEMTSNPRVQRAALEFLLK